MLPPPKRQLIRTAYLALYTSSGCPGYWGKAPQKDVFQDVFDSPWVAEEIYMHRNTCNCQSFLFLITRYTRKRLIKQRKKSSWRIDHLWLITSGADNQTRSWSKSILSDFVHLFFPVSQHRKEQIKEWFTQINDKVFQFYIHSGCCFLNVHFVINLSAQLMKAFWWLVTCSENGRAWFHVQFSSWKLELKVSLHWPWDQHSCWWFSSLDVCAVLQHHPQTTQMVENSRFWLRQKTMRVTMTLWLEAKSWWMKPSYQCMTWSISSWRILSNPGTWTTWRTEASISPTTTPFGTPSKMTTKNG